MRPFPGALMGLKVSDHLDVRRVRLFICEYQSAVLTMTGSPSVVSTRSSSTFAYFTDRWWQKCAVSRGGEPICPVPEDIPEQ